MIFSYLHFCETTMNGLMSSVDLSWITSHYLAIKYARSFIVQWWGVVREFVNRISDNNKNKQNLSKALEKMKFQLQMWISCLMKLIYWLCRPNKRFVLYYKLQAKLRRKELFKRRLKTTPYQLTEINMR